MLLFQLYSERRSFNELCEFTTKKIIDKEKKNIKQYFYGTNEKDNRVM